MCSIEGPVQPNLLDLFVGDWIIDFPGPTRYYLKITKRLGMRSNGRMLFAAGSKNEQRLLPIRIVSPGLLGRCQPDDGSFDGNRLELYPYGLQLYVEKSEVKARRSIGGFSTDYELGRIAPAKPGELGGRYRDAELLKRQDVDERESAYLSPIYEIVTRTKDICNALHGTDYSTLGWQAEGSGYHCEARRTFERGWLDYDARGLNAFEVHDVSITVNLLNYPPASPEDEVKARALLAEVVGQWFQLIHQPDVPSSLSLRLPPVPTRSVGLGIMEEREAPPARDSLLDAIRRQQNFVAGYPKYGSLKFDLKYTRRATFSQVTFTFEVAPEASCVHEGSSTMFGG